MNKKTNEYTKKINRLIKTFIWIAILVFLLGVLISIVQYAREKMKSQNNANKSSNEQYIINLQDGDIVFDKEKKIEFEMNNLTDNANYKIIIKVNDEIEITQDITEKNNTYNIIMNSEGKNNIQIIIVFNNEEVFNKRYIIYYIEPYVKNFGDDGSNKGVVVHYRDGLWENYNKDLNLLKTCGIKYIRTDFLWRAIDDGNGNYNFSKYDNWVTKAKEQDIKIIAILIPNGKICGDDMKINSDKELKEFENFVEALAKRYPEILEYEIYNEPNLSSEYTGGSAYTSDEYLQWYAKAVEEIKKRLGSINEKIHITGGATATPKESNANCMESTEFIRNISLYGAYDYADAFSYHPYAKENVARQNENLYTKIENHKKLFSNLGGFIKKYITEFGVYSSNGITEDVQSQKLIQQNCIIDGYNADMAIIYNFWNVGSDKNNSEANFGLLYNNYTPKPSYYAMKNYYQNTNGAEYIGSLNITNGLEAHTYDKDGHPLIIAWSNNTDNTYNFNINQMTAKDIYGKEIIPDSNGQIQITTSPVYLYNVPTNYFYQAISNTATTKYNEFTENYAEQISKVQGLQQTINTLNQRMKDLSSTSNLDETTSINLMKQHFNLGNTLIQAYKSGTLQIEYVKLSSMLDALNDIGNSFEDLVTVSAKTRNANISETLDTINKADNLINDNDIEMIYPSKILQFSQDFYEKASYINGLEEENDIKTGLIVSKNLHSKLLSDWATQFANLYIDTYIKNNPVTIDYSETNPTNQNVTATLRTNAQITINNNSNSKAYTFTQNGTFTFDYTIKGQTFQQTATVNNIDKTAPTIEGVENDRLYLSEVTPKASDTNLKEVLLYKDNNQVQNYQQNTQITEDGHYKLIAKDSAGNQTSVEFDISRNPAIIDYSEVNLTNQDVVATVNSNFDVNVKNNSNQKAYTFKENGEFTFELNIKGAELQLTAKVDNIDKTPPTITDVEDKKQYIDKVTPKISDDNLNEVKLYFDSEEVQGYTPNSEITGEGFYKLVAKDLAGNETSVEFTIIENPDEKYQIKDGNILNIKNNTNQDAFRKKLKMSGEYSIYRNDTLISDNDKIATGDKLRKSTGEEYTLIVSGDINNDGDVNIKDIVMLRKYLLERNNLNENSLLAADCNLDGKDISIKDLIRMRLIALERDVN